MNKFTSFIFEGYELNTNTGRITLDYSLDRKINFTESIQLQEFDKAVLEEKAEELDQAIFLLHLIGGISYYKTYCPPKIEVRSGTLTKKQARFWNTVYENGLGEFFYKNNVEFKNLIHFPSHPEKENPAPGFGKPKEVKRILIPIGGGKDSMATIELLKQKPDLQLSLLRMESHPIVDNLAHIAGLPLVQLKRSLSPNLFELNKQGAMNGHVPITAYLSILSVIVAIAEGFDAVVMSNERSASDGNVEYKGMMINHQWSKGLQFEKLLQDYFKDVGITTTYFSLLRPLTELHIARIFSQYPQYFEHFTSCNKNWKILDDEKNAKFWCQECPKCAFVFTILAAFLPKDQLEKIFGGNLYDDTKLLPLYRQLLNIDGFKPFECVGTPQETLAAFILAHERGDLNNTAAMKMAMKEVDLPDDVHALVAEQFTPSQEHAIPKEFQDLIFKA